MIISRSSPPRLIFISGEVLAWEWMRASTETLQMTSPVGSKRSRPKGSLDTCFKGRDGERPGV